ncbi:hypothetical protein B0H13DRAFT_1912894 [Mycena leptocephala]|nr:hypothetical protein B0H13DRAFT_1912894 [Mycena leptocephala]
MNTRAHAFHHTSKSFRPRPNAPAPALDPAAPAVDRERILPTMPFALPFTLFLLEAHLQGGWLQLNQSIKLKGIRKNCVRKVTCGANDHVEHRVRLVRYLADANAAASQHSPQSVDQLADLITGITLEDEGPNVRQQSPQSVDQLADLMTGITLTDEGPNVRQQPSKFFSTRDEFQDQAEIPTSPVPVPISIAQQSFQTVLGSVKYPGMRSVERNQNLLLDIRKQVQMARESLAGIDLLYTDNNHHQSMHLAVDAGTSRDLFRDALPQFENLQRRGRLDSTEGRAFSGTSRARPAH